MNKKFKINHHKFKYQYNKIFKLIYRMFLMIIKNKTLLNNKIQ